MNRAQPPNPGQPEEDLGLGRIIAQESGQRLVEPDGRLGSNRIGLQFWPSLNLYHHLIGLPWWVFLSLLALLFLSVNAAFATLYLWTGSLSLYASPRLGFVGLWLKDFFFSVETLATIGYGQIYPVTVLSNLVMTAESFLGLLGLAVATGLVFARFARPKQRILFSRSALIAPYGQGRALMFRIVNGLRTQVIDLEIRVVFTLFRDDHGARVRHFHTLELERAYVPLLPGPLTVVHPIGPESPLAALDPGFLRSGEAEFLVLLSGLDDTLFQPVRARASYLWSDLVWGARFRSMFVHAAGHLVTDVRLLNDVELLAEPPAAPPVRAQEGPGPL